MLNQVVVNFKSKTVISVNLWMMEHASILEAAGWVLNLRPRARTRVKSLRTSHLCQAAAEHIHQYFSGQQALCLGLHFREYEISQTGNCFRVMILTILER